MALNPWDYAAKTNTEHAHQVALFMWCNMAAKYGTAIAGDKRSYSKAGFAVEQFEAIRLKPDYAKFSYYKPLTVLSRLHAIHNQGHGDSIRGARAKAEGVKSGVPDMFLPVRIRDFQVPLGTAMPTICCGLYIELKRPSIVGKSKGKESDKQSEWGKYLTEAGFKYEVCEGWEAARDCILYYLALKESLKPGN